jgi:hypothetical protein
MCASIAGALLVVWRVGVNPFGHGFDGLNGSARIQRLAFENSVEQLEQH